MTANYADSSERQARANALADAADALRKVRLVTSGLAQTKLASNIETGELILVASWIMEGTGPTGVVAALIEKATGVPADSGMKEATRAVWETTGKPEPKVDDQPTVAYSPLEAYRQDPRKVTYPPEGTYDMLDHAKKAVQPYTRPVRDNPQA